VSIWAEGKLPTIKNLFPHKGEWRLAEVSGGFVLMAKEGHGFSVHRGAQATCHSKKVLEAFGPKLAMALPMGEDEEG
jgi:hypothetical protein